MFKSSIIAIMKATGISQNRLAEILGFKKSTFSRYVLGQRSPEGEAIHVINQAEAVLEEAKKQSITIVPDALTIAADKILLEKEILKAREKERDLHKKYLVLEKDLPKADTAMAWLNLWEQNSLHPQVPWAASYLVAEKGKSLMRLDNKQTFKVLAFDLKQAQERLQFLEKQLTDLLKE